MNGNGGTNPAWNDNAKEARLYAKGIITVTSSSKISKIVYKYVVNANKSNKFPTVSSVTPDGFDESSNTWSSEEGSNSVKMTLGGSAGNFGFTSLVITYVDDDKTPTSISFPQNSYVFDEGTGDKEFTNAAILTPAEAGSVTYNSSNEELAIVGDDGSVIVSTDKVGTATITAKFEAQGNYSASEASYTITVVKSVKVEDGVFDFSGNEDYGSGVTKTSSSSDYVTTDKTWTAGNVTMVTSGKYRWWEDTSGLRFYGGNFTVSVPDGYVITKVDLDGTFTFTAQPGKFEKGVWTGSSSSVKFTSNSNGKDLDKVTVTYVKLETLTTAASSYATYSADYATNYSEAGLTAFTVKVNGDKVVATEYTGVVPAGKAVLVKGEASKAYTLAPATETAGEFATDLLASDGKVTSDGASYFAFSSSKGTKGFKLVGNDVTIPAKKGYLKVENTAGANFLSFDDETLGINAATATAAADGKAYNMAGQRVSKAYKGLVIIGGKKYLNK